MEPAWSLPGETFRRRPRQVGAGPAGAGAVRGRRRLGRAPPGVSASSAAGAGGQAGVPPGRAAAVCRRAAAG